MSVLSMIAAAKPGVIDNSSCIAVLRERVFGGDAAARRDYRLMTHACVALQRLKPRTLRDGRAALTHMSHSCVAALSVAYGHLATSTGPASHLARRGDGRDVVRGCRCRCRGGRCATVLTARLCFQCRRPQSLLVLSG